MNNSIVLALIVLSAIGIISAIILYIVAQKFKVIENPKIDEVNDILPQANCGGCGFAGCRAFAEALVNSETMDGFYCPVGGNDLLKNIGPILGQVPSEKDPLIAVVRCSGSKQNSKAKVIYDGPASCLFSHNLSAGEGGCKYSCLGDGDCVRACTFDAMYMDENTGLPVIKDNCVACNACVKACPRSIIELRKRGKKDRRIFVSCVNKEKGGISKLNCDVSCTGCTLCQKECKFDAITIINNLAYIDFEKCTLCRKCVPVCPTNAIHELNFAPRKEKVVSVESINSLDL